jgi:DHA1 family bicyclomycin/chloramphenicol resistance-like MFS transporter
MADDHLPATAQRPSKPLLACLILASSLTLAASGILVPAIPGIARSLGASVSMVQLSFATYLGAFAGGLLLMGPISDRWGRRRVLLIGLGLSVAGSIGGAASPSVEWFIGMRLLQGFGASAGTVVTRALVADLYDREGAAGTLAVLGIASTLVQIAAPSIGGQLEIGPGWRLSFILVACIAALALILASGHIPSNTASQRACSAREMIRTYRRLLQRDRFLGYALTAAGTHAGSHAFAAGIAPVLTGRYGMSAVFTGLCAAAPPLGFLVGSALARRLIGWRDGDTLITFGLAPLVLAGAAMLTLAFAHIAHPAILIAPMIIISAASGVVTPNAVAGSLSTEETALRGTASGLTTFLQISGGVAATCAVAVLPAGPRAFALVISACGGLALIAFTWMIRRHQATSGSLNPVP